MLGCRRHCRAFHSIRIAAFGKKGLIHRGILVLCIQERFQIDNNYINVDDEV